MSGGLFIAGTGTSVGKTLVAAGLLRRLRARGVDAVPMKPVQTGALRRADGSWLAPDLELALSAAGLTVDAETRAHLSPFCYAPACSPHLAARIEGRPIELDRIAASAQWLAQRHGALVVEAAGGVLVPLGEGALMVDLMARLALPVVLVSPSGLGALNHALLSLEALRARGLAVLGVVLCDTAPASAEDRYIREDNGRAIAEIGRTRVLARVPYLGDPVAWPSVDRWLSGCVEALEAGCR
jgi:dethiobiotin synthase